ncbi:MAG: FtsQ-type POTRA domain-containing protein [Clostridia bacterium]|nr:FtsQ-type POTRA domain-containing protein [Clostridia bacterium]
MNRENQQGTERRLTPEERQIRIKQLKRKRRIRKAIVAIGFLLVLCVAVSPVLLLTVFKVKSFTVEGADVYTNEEIISASGIVMGKNLLFADLDEAAEKIEKLLPYTDEVKLTKKLPDGIIIRYEATEKAFAIGMSNGLYAITNGNLKVLEISGKLPNDVALIVGAVPYKADVGEIAAFDVLQEGEKKDEFVDETLNLLLEITGAITENKTEDIDLINVADTSDIYLIYQGRIVLNLGNSSDLPSKLSLGNKVINSENTIDPFQFGAIDLSIVTEAVFNPSDMKDVPEVMYYIENYAPEASEEENAEDEGVNEPETDENDE